MSANLNDAEFYSINYNMGNGLPSNTIYSVYQASDGHIWVCSDEGVSRFDGHHFERYSVADGLPDNEIFKVFEDSQQRLWFLTLNGKLGYYQDGQFFNEQNKAFLSQPKLNTILLDIIEDTTGRVLICSENSGIAVVTDDEVEILELNQTLSAFVKYQEMICIVAEKRYLEVRSYADYQ